MIKIGLDIDGVLNSLTWPRSELGPPWREHIIEARVGTLSVALRNDWKDRLNSLAAEAEADIFWNTMWGHEANTLIAPIIGLPEWEWAPVQQRFSDYDMGLIKARTAYRFMADNYPLMPFAVIDDEPGVGEALDELMFYDDVTPWLFVQVDPNEGLSQKNVDEVVCFGQFYAGRE